MSPRLLPSNHVMFVKQLDIEEITEDGETVPVTYIVVDAFIGYNVLRLASEPQIAHWGLDRDLAIETCIEKAKDELFQRKHKEADLKTDQPPCQEPASD